MINYLNLAKTVSEGSKDPSTKCGAVIVRPDRTVASIGYNGFPRGIEDKKEFLENREEKYKRTIHAETNAILAAKESLEGYSIYVHPFCPCSNCALNIIQSGIKKITYPYTEPNERWNESWKLTAELFAEAGVKIETV